MKRRMSPWGAGFGVGRSSESSAMASGPPDVMANPEAAEVAEECSGKKKSKFQTFKKFFTRKKRKEPSACGADAALKGSQSTDNISRTSENNTLTQSEKDKGSGSKISLGSKALSHDSVFASDSSEANEALGASQDSIHGKVKSLQLQLKQAIRLGSPPSLMCVKRTEDMGTMSEDDGLPCSPPEYTTHTALAQVQGNSSISLEGMDGEEDQLSCAASSRGVSLLVVVPGDFSQPASPLACLDNSAAKHKMGLRHKACNKRKPATRLELKAEGDSVVEDILNSSTSEAVEESDEQKIKDAGADEFKPKEEEEEKEQAEHSTQSLLSDNEEREESSSEPEAEQDVSDGPDTSCPPEMGLSEEEAADARPWASSETGSGASSRDSPRGTPEPPAGQREYQMDLPSIAYGTEEKRDQRDSVIGLTGGEDGEQEPDEEESSLLQEVLSSLKAPLNSPLMKTESIVLDMEQEEVKNTEEEEEDKEEAETEGEEEVEEEPVIDLAVVSGSPVSDQNTKEEEELTTTTASYNDAEEEMKDGEEEEEDDSTEEEEEEEELVVEHFSPYDVEEVEKEDVEEIEAEEENKLRDTQTDNQVEEEEEEEEKVEKEKEEEEEVEEEEEEEGEVEEEETKELEHETEVSEEKLEETVEDNKEEDVEVENKDEEVEEAEEAKENETEDVQEKFADVVGGEMVVDAEKKVNDVNTVNRDETQYEQDGDKVLSGQEETDSDQIEPEDRNLDQEKDTAACEPTVEETRSEHDKEQETIQVFPQETEQEKEQSDVDTTISSRPSSLTRPETPTTPSKTSTIHINLISPSAEKATSCFQLPPSTVEAKDSMSTAEEPGDKVDKVEEEEEQPCEAATAINKEAEPFTPIDEPSKVRFTITPAWQRSLSIEEKDSTTLPSSPPASVSSSCASGGMEVATAEEPSEEAESPSSAKVELVLSPSRAKTSEMTTTKPQRNMSPTTGKPQMEEKSVVVKGNPNNPFGVRLRKTSALQRFSSEEENAEPVHESAPQPSSCSSDSPQPLSFKPSVSQPISNKPALPKKPEVTGDKLIRISDPTAARGGCDPPSWISMAKQKQKIYKENSGDNTAVQKEEKERKSSVPVNSSSNRTPGSPSKVSPVELDKSSASVEKESRRSLSPPTPVPPQPTKCPSLPLPVPPKPHVTPPTMPKPSPQRSLSPTTPVPFVQRPPSCTNPPSTSKPTPSLPTANMTLTSPPFSSSRTTPAQSTGSSPTPATQRGVPPPTLTQDEPPWMALAKKKAKAWSEMPQIVQ